MYLCLSKDQSFVHIRVSKIFNLRFTKRISLKIILRSKLELAFADRTGLYVLNSPSWVSSGIQTLSGHILLAF